MVQFQSALRYRFRHFLTIFNENTHTRSQRSTSEIKKKSKFPLTTHLPLPGKIHKNKTRKKSYIFFHLEVLRNKLHNFHIVCN